MRPKTGISARQERAILALLTAGSVEKAATLAGVARATLWRWSRSDAAFQRAYREARARAFSDVTARLQQTALKAATTLEAIAGDSKAPATARVLACRTILEFSVARMQVEDMEGRLRDLEEAATAAGR